MDGKKDYLYTFEGSFPKFKYNFAIQVTKSYLSKGFEAFR